jgi:hypothetical protein
MVTHTKIGRLSERIEALAQQCLAFRSDDLTDKGWAKLERLAGESAHKSCAPDPEARQWSTEKLLRFLFAEGVLTPADFKRRPPR